MPKKKKVNKSSSYADESFSENHGKLHSEEANIVELKQRKSRCKSAFTRSKNVFLNETDNDTDKSYAKELLEKVERNMDDAISSINELCNVFKVTNRTQEMMDTYTEIEAIEQQYNEISSHYNDIFGSKSRSKDVETTKDMYQQLQRVQIPVYTGVKKDYEFWVSAFNACIDGTNASPEYKFLQLRQYLGGDALKTVEGLGHSAEAYEAAKSRLQRKYGGTRRKVNRFIEEINSFPIIRYENAKMIEKYANLLEIAVIKMKEGDEEDLKSGFMYNELLKKLPHSMISRYQRWIYEKHEQETIEKLKEWVAQESEFNIIAMETKFGLDNKPDGRKTRETNQTFLSNSKKVDKRETKFECKLCSGKHGIWSCENFKSLPTEARWEKAKSLKLCFRCLSDRHMGKDCTRKWTCKSAGCSKSHHTLLHSERSQNTESVLHGFRNDEIDQEQETSRYIGLRTVPVIVSYGSKDLKINALLDDGSTQTYINMDTALALGIPFQNPMQSVTVNVLNGKTERFSTTSVQFALKSMNGQINIAIEASTIDKVTGNLHAIEIKDHADKWQHLQGIKFPAVGKRQHIDMLIGLDYADLHQSLHEVHGNPGEPIARLTPLGWTCVGNLVRHNNSGQTGSYHTFLLHENQNEINKTLRRFWEIDDGGIENETECMSKNDKLFLEKAENSIESIGQQPSRYQIDIPWNDNKVHLCDNSEMAMKRLYNTEKRLIKDPTLHQKYNEIICDYVEKGYVTKTTENEEKAWYIPHFPVLRPDKSTTKVRIVFDASAKYNGISLNDAIDQGPPLQADLFDVIVRFRRHSVAVVCDIQEMYLQVGIPVPDRQYHRFLWRSNPESPIETFEFSRLVFGINASPFLAQCVSRYNAKVYADKFPLAKETVLKSTYMDDSIDSVSNEETGIKLYHELSELWQKAGMFARKWLSNSPQVLKHIPEQDRAIEADFSKTEQSEIKTLGVLWQADRDCFTFRYRDIDIHDISKREFLSKISTLYDPLGFLVPFTIRAKMLMQDVWVSGTDWDEELNFELNNQVKSWFGELPELDEVKVLRNLQYREHEKSKLHTFVDASTKAYCAVTYLRNENEAGEIDNINIIAAKSKVAPIKSTSVPRLELLAAVLGLRLSEKVCKSLEYDIKDVCFWSDSMNTLWWIHNQSRQFKPFVANRLGDIQGSTNPEQWRYVPSENNPADLGSRGTTIKQLKDEKLWWSGPEFLAETSEKWPKNNFKPDEKAKYDQKKRFFNSETQVLHVTAAEEEDKLDPQRFSSWMRLVRVYAWVLRFINNCQMKKNERQSDKSLKPDEIESVEEIIIQKVQREQFSEEYKAPVKGKERPKSSKILNLNPKLDEAGILRSDSRLKYAEFIPYDSRYPIILPRNDWVTKLIVRHFHDMCNHGGTNQTLAALSSRFLIIAAREEIREVENECRVCRKRKVKASQQIMGPISELRLGKSMRAFSETAVDYAGPFLTKQGRGKPRNKRYLCLFTCMACRAVHLELAYSLDTDAFLNAFYRFVSRRGLPKVVLSDNGTNFVGAVRELRELVDALDKDKITNNVANKGIKWKFIPPAAPHFGGVHEAMVKSAKRAIYAILGNADINDEELLTAFCGAEGLINSRPLTYQSANPEDEPVLTPNHFLHGQVGGLFAPESVDITAFNVKKRWRRVQELVKHFWGRWFQEFLPMLGSRKKWQQKKRDFQVGDIVTVIDPDVGRGHWKIGRVVEVFTGPDGHVRVVNVLVGDKVMKRPITRVCLLEENQAK